MAEAATELSMTAVRLKPGGSSFDETVAGGEIVGLAGLDGHGQEEFLEALAGLHPLQSGMVTLRGPGGVSSVHDYRSAIRSGVLYLPRDRRTSGIFPNLSVLDNFAMASLANDLRHGLIDLQSRRLRYEGFRRRLSIVADDENAPITRLSGGNQQKVLLARMLARNPRALLLNDPTRGVDVATRRVLYGLFRELAADRMAIVILSTEIEELTGLCDRVLVFRDFELARHLSGGDLTSARVIAAMFGEAS